MESDSSQKNSDDINNENCGEQCDIEIGNESIDNIF